jgi:hypothetical protein
MNLGGEDMPNRWSGRSVPDQVRNRGARHHLDQGCLQRPGAIGAHRPFALRPGRRLGGQPCHGVSSLPACAAAAFGGDARPAGGSIRHVGVRRRGASQQCDVVSNDCAPLWPIRPSRSGCIAPSSSCARPPPTRAFSSDSPVDSGYSLDNLAPGIPANFVYHAGTLSWRESSDDDFDYFSVYGSSTNSFGAATLIDYSVAPSLDVSTMIYNYYWVTATDFSGNEGRPAKVSPLTARETIHLIMCSPSRPIPIHSIQRPRFVIRCHHADTCAWRYSTCAASASRHWWIGSTCRFLHGGVAGAQRRGRECELRRIFCAADHAGG